MEVKKTSSKLNKYIKQYRNLSLAAKATIWFMVCSIVQKSFSLCTTPIFTRLMTKEQYGVYSVYLSWLQIMTILVTLRLDFSIFNKGMATYPKQRDEYTSSMLGITTILNAALLVICIVFMPKIKVWTELNTPIILGMIVELFFIPAVSFWSLRERYEFHYRNVVAVTLVTALLNALFGIVAVTAFQDKGTARVLSCVIAQSVVGIFIFYEIFHKGKRFFSQEYTRFAISFNLILIPYYFASYVIEQSDRIMIQKMIGLEAAALYNLAYTAGGIIKIVSNTLSNSLIPLMFRQLGSGEYKDTRVLMGKVMRFVMLVLPIFVCIAPEAVLIMGGREYYPARFVIPPVAMSVFFSFMYAMIANVDFYYDKAKFTTITSVIAAVLNLVLNWIFIPMGGYVVAAYTTLVSYVFLALCHLVYVRKIMLDAGRGQVIDCREMAAYSVITVVANLLICALYPFPVIRYILIVLSLACLYWKRDLLKWK